MAFTDFDAFRERVRVGGYASNQQRAPGATTASANLDNIWGSLITVSGIPEALSTPSAAVALDRSSASSMRHPLSSGRCVIIGAEMPGEQNLLNTSVGGSMPGLVIDRLSHNGGLVGNVNTLQDSTSNPTAFPTAALTRYTDGIGVMLAVHIYTSLGATDSVLTVNYTNTANAAKVGTAIFTGTPQTHNFILVGLAAGDLGVKSVQSVQLSASTGTAGNFGVVLFKPIAIIPPGEANIPPNEIVGWNTGIHDDAFLEILFQPRWLTGSNNYAHLLHLTDA